MADAFSSSFGVWPAGTRFFRCTAAISCFSFSACLLRSPIPARTPWNVKNENVDYDDNDKNNDEKHGAAALCGSTNKMKFGKLDSPASRLADSRFPNRRMEQSHVFL